MNKKELTSNELCEIMRISHQTVKRWREEGMPHRSYGPRTKRYIESEVREWLEKRNHTQN